MPRTTTVLSRVQSRLRTAALAAAALAALLSSDGLRAQDWPSRQLTLVVPFAAGGPTDMVGRTIAAGVSEVLQQQVVVENIGGAGGTTGVTRVVRGPADGHQFVLGGLGGVVINQLLYKKPPFNAAEDLAPIALLSSTQLVLITRKDLPAKTLTEFIAYAKANPSMTFGSGGAGSTSHLACILLNAAIGASATHVPYRGTNPAMQDLRAGRIDFLCEFVSTALPQIKDDAVNAIATLSRTRSAVLPDIATAQEQGLANFEVDSWLALFFPKATPPGIVAKLGAAAAKAMDLPSVRERLGNAGVGIIAPEHRGADYLSELMKRELAKWAAPIKASGVVIE